jgi:tRNA(fMet)-specific endonuclease VapC
MSFQKSGRPIVKGFTTIFNIIEYPKGAAFKELVIIYPTIEDYEESLNLATELLMKGTPLHAVDIMVAAMCIRRDLTLSTQDKDFANVKKVRSSFRFELIK